MDASTNSGSPLLMLLLVVTIFGLLVSVPVWYAIFVLPAGTYVSGEKHPSIPLFIGVGGHLLDFWSTMFLSAGNQASTFQQKVEDCLKEAGHPVSRTDGMFATQMIGGETRPFLFIPEHFAYGLIYIHKIGAELSDLYASYRIVYVGEIVRWRVWLLNVSLVPFALVFAVPVSATLESILTLTMKFSTYQSDLDVWYWGSVAALLVLFHISIYLWCLWRYGDGNALFRKNFNELYRDDASALAHELYLAINSVADSLELERFPLREEGQAAPTFASTAQTNISRRRI